jgi:hypothetical protein
MSTRSYIACPNTDGTYTAIYCHHDGYPSGVGAKLAQAYTSPERVGALLQLGALSSLSARLEPVGAHSFDEPETGTTVAYHRDRGEDWDMVKPVYAPDLMTLASKARNAWAEYLYVFLPGGARWECFGLIDENGEPALMAC